MTQRLPGALSPDVSRRRSGNFLSLLSPLLHLIWPAACPVCGRLGELVCESCLRSLLRPAQAFCLECGGAWPCGFHGEGAPCFAGSRYGGPCRSVVHTMKYRNGRRIARRMGRLLAASLERPAADFLVPVPLHRESKRGYNQAELIAEGAGEVWGIPVRSMLRWGRRAERQARKAGSRARGLPAGAVEAGPGLVRGASVFLTDDVFTTGNTMRAAREALLRGGAVVAGALVWSRSGGKPEGIGGKTDDV